MPLAVVGVGSLEQGTFCLYLLKKQQPANLYVIQSLMNETTKQKETQQGINKEDVKKLLNLAESESERERLKYAVVKSAGISNTKAKSIYGFQNMGAKKTKVEQAMEEACAIKDAIEKIAKIKEKAVLQSLGVYETSESQESDNEESESETDSDSAGFVDFNDSSEVTSESGSSEAEIWAKGVGSVLDERGKLLIKKRRAFLRRKCVRQTKKRLAEARLMRRKRSKKVGRIISECPGIGEEIEMFVKQCGAGADAWRRTGILTFDGNRKIKKKATFRRIKEHLEIKYGRKISYGSVVQLCCARNKRRRSAARYHGLAKVVSKRARKGFTIRYNPDQHWSSSLYAGLDKLQHEDGCNIINIGRDDQAGFRLDTMATNKQHATLCVKGREHLTTRTDYVNKYPSTLQTTSYNFPSTKTTGEICGGVVKAPILFEKNPAQHFADLEMLENQEEVIPVFINPVTGKRKEIECVRVDGSFDEGPSHLEVQYWWTVRHLKSKSRFLLVTSRNSGASYKNRVELQNGCLALAHANLFIPSTLNGSCLKSGGKINEKLLPNHDNLSSAIDVYLSRVDKAPCAETEIHLFRGADSSNHQHKNKLVVTFLKGTKEAKKRVENDHPDEVKQIKQIWDLKERHMRKDVPEKYIFCLSCCYETDCIHPLCQEGPPQEEYRWYPGGPPLSFLPIPSPDPARPYGQTDCQDCEGQCLGHYLKVDELWNLVSKMKGQNVHHDPPSKTILEEFNHSCEVPEESKLLEISEKVLLSHDETEMWFKHLKNVHENRKKGVAKAIETRKAKKMQQQLANKDKDRTKEKGKKAKKKNNQEEEESEVCCTCNLEVPCGLEDEQEEIDWISCDSCACWHHMICVGIIVTDGVPHYWQCLNCIESWE